MKTCKFMKWFVIGAWLLSGCAVQAPDDREIMAVSTALECQDDCAEGALQCVPEAAAFQACGNFDEDECLEWGEATACAAGDGCLDGACVCADLCPAEGALQCVPDAAAFQACGNFDEDECLEWGEATACAAGDGCLDGACVCQDLCPTGGVNHCADANSFALCGDFDADGCLELEAATACAEGDVCADGACICQDLCPAEGGVHCVDAINFAFCGNFDGDECLELGVAVACEEGLVCELGQCVIDCSDECTGGGSRCATGFNGTETCGNFDVDECLEWGGQTACTEIQTCQEGACVDLCAHECTADEKRCLEAAAAYEVCGQFDEDPCVEWGGRIDCSANQACEDGGCVDVCADECPAGQRQCVSGQNAFQICGNSDPDACLEWGTPSPCAHNQTCVAASGTCEWQYPAGPYGTILGKTIKNECLDEAICTGSSPQGQAFCFKNYLGKKAILFSIHTGWCSACKQQTAEMEAFYQQYKDRGLAIILVNYQDQYYRTDRTNLLRYACNEKGSYGLTFTSAVDPNGTVSKRYIEQYIPLNIVLDDDMVIRYKGEGYDEQELSDIIEQLLDE